MFFNFGGVISQQLIKYIKNLQLEKKKRDVEKKFVAEGGKIIRELLRSPYSDKIDLLIGTPVWIEENIGDVNHSFEIIKVPREVMNKISALSSPSQVLAVVKKDNKQLNIRELGDNIIVCLDRVQDPGNLGNIIRVSHWFGVKAIVCNIGTIDVYNPKVVQSTMGSIFFVDVYYTNLPWFLREYRREVKAPVYGFMVEGTNILSVPKEGVCALVFGNEGSGLLPEVRSALTFQVKIPSFSSNMDSLNVGSAVSIALHEFRRLFML